MRLLPIMLTVAIGLVLLFPLGTAEPAQKVLSIALGQEPDSLNPVDENNVYECNKVFSGLIKSDENLKMTPDLAESWEVLQSGKEYVFHLRKNVTWQDGVPFKADDVKFTYDLLKSQNWASVLTTSYDYKNIDVVKIVDDYTVQFSVHDGIVPFQEKFTTPILPKHLLEGQDLANTDFWLHPVGIGPYKFVEWNKGEDLVLTANHDYYGSKPKIETVKYVFVPDVNARVSLLKEGEVDAIKLDPRSESALNGTSGIKIIDTPAANWYSLSLPNNIWPLEIKEVRQAIAYAIDKQEILDTVFFGRGEIAYGPYRKANWVYNPDVAYSYDPEKAKQLLASAGFVDSDGDSILEKDGKKLQFDLVYASSEKEREDLAIAVKGELGKVGISVNPVAKTFDEFDYDLIHNHALTHCYGTAFDPDNIKHNFESSYIDETVGGSWGDASSYVNPEVDKLLQEGRTTWDNESRKAQYQKLQKILVGDQPFVFIVFSDYLYAVSDKITGIKPRFSPHGYENGALIGELWWNVDEWDIKE